MSVRMGQGGGGVCEAEEITKTTNISIIQEF